MTNSHRAGAAAHGHSQPHGLASDNKVKFALAKAGSDRVVQSTGRVLKLFAPTLQLEFTFPMVLTGVRPAAMAGMSKFVLSVSTVWMSKAISFFIFRSDRVGSRQPLWSCTPCLVPGMVSFPFERDPVIPCTQVTLIGFGSDWKSDEGVGKGALVNWQRRSGDFDVSSSRPAVSLWKGPLQDPLLRM